MVSFQTEDRSDPHVGPLDPCPQDTFELSLRTRSQLAIPITGYSTITPPPETRTAYSRHPSGSRKHPPRLADPFGARATSHDSRSLSTPRRRRIAPGARAPRRRFRISRRPLRRARRQNVNKVETKIELRIALDDLPPAWSIKQLRASPAARSSALRTSPHDERFEREVGSNFRRRSGERSPAAQQSAAARRLRPAHPAMVPAQAPQDASHPRQRQTPNRFKRGRSGDKRRRRAADE